MPIRNGAPERIEFTPEEYELFAARPDTVFSDGAVVIATGKVAAPLSPRNSLVNHAAASFSDAVRQIWTGDLINEYLAASDTRRHVWHAWLSSPSSAPCTQNQMSSSLAYKQLTFFKSEDLLQQAYGCKPAGIIKALGKLGSRARCTSVYRALVRVMAVGGPAAKFIQHQSSLQDNSILGLAMLPPNARIKAIVDILKSGELAPETLSFFIGTLAWFEAHHPATARTIVDATNVRSGSPLDALWEALEALPFPAPPWPESRHLIPVRSRTRLAEIAKAFQNCLASVYPDRHREAVMGVLNENRCFYELRDEPALLEFVNVRPLGWYLRQICGPENRDVSERTSANVLSYLALQPTFRGVWESQWSGRWNGFDQLSPTTRNPTVWSQAA